MSFGGVLRKEDRQMDPDRGKIHQLTIPPLRALGPPATLPRAKISSPSTSRKPSSYQHRVLYLDGSRPTPLINSPIKAP